MQRKQVETGCLRIYYVIWFLFTVGMSSALVHEFAPDVFSNLDYALLGLAVLLCFVLPWMLLVVFRWVYQGFLAN